MRKCLTGQTIAAALAGALILTVAVASQPAVALDTSAPPDLIPPPYELGEKTERDGVWTLLDSGGGVAGTVIETRLIAPLPGFAGKPMSLLIVLDRQGRFLDVKVLEQYEPVFVAGLGVKPFETFLQQYRGHSAAESLTIGVPTDAADHGASGHVYLDGVSRATASVRIANETVLAAARDVLREGAGAGSQAIVRPIRNDIEDLDWRALVEQGIAQPLTITNADVERAFANTRWADEDEEARINLDATYLDAWVIDVGPTSIARTILDDETLASLGRVLAEHEEPVLLLANGRQGLVDEKFVRNTVPDRIAARQGDFPLEVRHADIEVRLKDGVPAFEQALLLRIDRRFGFDPTLSWELEFRAIRAHGSFRPEREARAFTVDYAAPSRFFDRQDAAGQPSAVRDAIVDRAGDIAGLVIFLAVLFWLMARRLRPLARNRYFPVIRLSVLVVTVVGIGWWGQGQLSIVTPLAILSAVIDGRSLAFLLYDPFSLLLWVVTFLSLAVWGRGFFCGWICPFGALQEFTYSIGRRLNLPRIRIRPRVDAQLKKVKYAVLAVLVAASLTSASATGTLIEVEPFKTAITLGFDRAWPFVLYAVFWLVLGLFIFKGFCRWICPLGAALAVSSLARKFDWIDRRAECGSPCQFCKARCVYGAIDRLGRIDYAECFQCLECVRINETPTLCVPDRLVLKKQMAAR
jgi:transcriptional regulator of nitric oxide reductase